MFVDTNVVILYLANSLEFAVLDILEKEVSTENGFISNIVLAEVLAYNKYKDSEAKEISKLLSKRFKVVNIDSKIVELSAKIIRDKRNETGKKLKLTDAIIAATAILKKKPLLTLDIEDFRNIKSLKLAIN